MNKIILLALSLIISLNIYMVAYSQEIEIIRLAPTDDAYVMTNTNDPSDKLNLNKQNTGNLEFLKVLHANNVTTDKEDILTIAYLKFDLSGVDAEKIASAELKMLSLQTRKVGESRPVYLFYVDDNSWHESELNFNNRPIYYLNLNASTQVGNSGNWYSWNVADIVKQKAGSKVSMAIVLKDFYFNQMEEFAFYSKDADNTQNIPYLAIQYGALPQTLNQGEVDELVSTDSLLTITASLIAGAIIGGTAVALIRRKNVNAKQKTFVSTKKQPDPSKSQP